MALPASLRRQRSSGNPGLLAEPLDRRRIAVVGLGDGPAGVDRQGHPGDGRGLLGKQEDDAVGDVVGVDQHLQGAGILRSEEHTSELQSLMRISYAVFCLKKKKKLTE